MIEARFPWGPIHAPPPTGGVILSDPVQNAPVKQLAGQVLLWSKKKISALSRKLGASVSMVPFPKCNF